MQSVWFLILFNIDILIRQKKIFPECSHCYEFFISNLSVLDSENWFQSINFSVKYTFYTKENWCRYMCTHFFPFVLIIYIKCHLYWMILIKQMIIPYQILVFSKLCITQTTSYQTVITSFIKIVTVRKAWRTNTL